MALHLNLNRWTSALKGSLSPLPLLLILLLTSCQAVTSLGENPEGEELKKIETLPNYKNGQFQNLEQLSPPPSYQPSRKPRWLGMTKYFFGKPKITRPPRRVPVMITDLKKATFGKPTVIWFGHSSVLVKTATGNILFDPSFSGFAGPFDGLIKAFAGTNAYDGRDMPTIDVLVISHDHYDHLDYQTVMQLKKKVKRVIVPVGVGSHFRRWGYDPARITELNWNESVTLTNQLTITATPAHHRSNRTFEQRKTLWASYVVHVDGYKIYFSGDTGYSKHFKLIGEQYGPFDLALLECGQYNPMWSQSHMFPEQTAQAALDLKTAMTIPIHWGKFAESTHPWNESVNRLLVKAENLNVAITIPFIGQPYPIGDSVLQVAWWNLLDE
jgi:L-ascorbate metabolism protein UlaG (beta-lactamase superfamily)